MRSLLLAALAFAFTGAPAFAASQFNYTCYPTEDNGGEKQSLTVTPRTITLDGHKLALDPKYKPRLNKDYNRYDGDTRWLTPESDQMEVLVHKSALAGVNKTWLKISARGESFYKYTWYCYRR